MHGKVPENCLSIWPLTGPCCVSCQVAGELQPSVIWIEDAEKTFYKKTVKTDREVRKLLKGSMKKNVMFKHYFIVKVCSLYVNRKYFNSQKVFLKTEEEELSLYCPLLADQLNHIEHFNDSQ